MLFENLNNSYCARKDKIYGIDNFREYTRVGIKLKNSKLWF